MNITIDASVYISACFQSEVNHIDSDRFLGHILHVLDNTKLAQPNIFLPELYSALTARGATTKEIEQNTRIIIKNPIVTYLDIDEKVTEKAMDIIRISPCRGMDSIYIATADIHDSILVTLDRRQKQAAKAIIPAYTPWQFMEEYS